MQEHENKDHREHKAGAAADGDNGAAVPLPGWLDVAEFGLGRM